MLTLLARPLCQTKGCVHTAVDKHLLCIDCLIDAVSMVALQYVWGKKKEA